MVKFLVFILMIKALCASGQVTHLYFAQQYLKNHPEWDVKAFLRGTLFPDIRYLANLPKSATHQKARFQSIKSAATSFEAGMRLHWAIDQIAFDYYVKQNLYTFLGDPQLSKLFKSFTQDTAPLLVKLAQDEILLARICKGALLRSYFDGEHLYLPENAVSKEVLKTWHRSLLLTFENPPSTHLEELMPVHSFAPSEMRKFKSAICTCASNAVFQAYVEIIHRAIEKELFKL